MHFTSTILLLAGAASALPVTQDSPSAETLERRTNNNISITNFSASRAIDSSSYSFDICDELHQITAHCSASVSPTEGNGNNLDSVSQGTCTAVDQNGVPAKEPIDTNVFNWSFTAETYGGTLVINEGSFHGDYAGFATGRSGSEMFEYITEPADFIVETTDELEPPN